MDELLGRLLFCDSQIDSIRTRFLNVQNNSTCVFILYFKIKDYHHHVVVSHTTFANMCPYISVRCAASIFTPLM